MCARRDLVGCVLTLAALAPVHSRRVDVGEIREGDLCPDECAECCRATNVGGLLVSKSKFKCVLKNPLNASGPEFAVSGCDKPAARVYSAGMKAECTSTPAYISSLSKQVCSQRTMCCCHNDDSSNEIFCAPMSEKAQTLWMNGKKYERLTDSEQSFAKCIKDKAEVCSENDKGAFLYDVVDKHVYHPSPAVSRTYKSYTYARYVCLEQKKWWRCGMDGMSSSVQGGWAYKRTSAVAGTCLADFNNAQRLNRIYKKYPYKRTKPRIKHLEIKEAVFFCPQNYTDGWHTPSASRMWTREGLWRGVGAPPPPDEACQCTDVACGPKEI